MPAIRAPPPERFCSQCRHHRPAADFVNRSGGYGLLCRTHVDAHAAANRLRRQQVAQARAAESSDDDGERYAATGRSNTTKVSYPDLLRRLANNKKTRGSVAYLVELTD